MGLARPRSTPPPPDPNVERVAKAARNAGLRGGLSHRLNTCTPYDGSNGSIDLGEREPAFVFGYDVRVDPQQAPHEDLPPLELSALRELDLEEASAPDRPAHVSSASGVARRGDYVYVIGDDELSLAVFQLSEPGPGTLRKALEGTLPTGADARAKEKADLEALTPLPPFEGCPYGALLGLGSGSGPGRDRGFAWALAADGSLEGDPVQVDMEPVYALMREHDPELNVEGAAVIGNRLWLLHRGNTERGVNLVAELELGDVLASLGGDHEIDCEELSAVRGYDLGELDGVPLSFSDATPIADQLLVFTASAEAEDGAIRGSVVGTIDGGGDVQRLRTIDQRWKVEGVYASIDTGVMDFLFVCDQDDPDVASPLLSAAMPVEGRLEYRR